MTYQTIYFSASSTPMQVDELEDILEQAQSNNSRNGITGALVYIDGSFLQILEGEKDRVQTLMQKISKDILHETVSVLHEGKLQPQRSLSGKWPMSAPHRNKLPGGLA